MERTRNKRVINLMTLTLSSRGNLESQGGGGGGVLIYVGSKF